MGLDHITLLLLKVARTDSRHGGITTQTLNSFRSCPYLPLPASSLDLERAAALEVKVVLLRLFREVLLQLALDKSEVFVVVDGPEEGALHPGGLRIGGGGQGTLSAFAAIPAAASAFPARTGRVPPEVLQWEKGVNIISQE